MNIILFTKEEIGSPLSLEDPRGRHIVEILGCKKGDRFKSGIIRGSRGVSEILELSDDQILFSFTPYEEETPLYPLYLIVGMPRPQTAKKILHQAASLGVAGLYFVTTETGEKSYHMSKLWTKDEYKKHLIEGAQQAYSTKIPDVKRFYSLKKCIESLGEGDKIVFDNYSEAFRVKDLPLNEKICYIAIGSERGWTENELKLFKEAKFVSAHLGKRALRCETAAVGAAVLVLENKNFI